MGSSRFPGKPLKKILGIPMIEHVYKRAKLSPLLSDVYVATCDESIYNHIVAIGGKAIMTKDTHERCTERTAEALLKIENITGVTYDIVLMLQGDEPMITPEMIELSLTPFKNEKNVQVVNLMTPLSFEEHRNPNEIKVVTDKFNNALYFSREPIPTTQKGFTSFTPMKQVCVIPFRRNFLLDYLSWEPTVLEIAESIDMNRVLENGEKVKMVICHDKSHAVDVPSDIEKLEIAMRNDLLLKTYA